MFNTRLLSLTLALLLSAGPALAATYHVAVDGSNDNPGTADQPFATIQHAVNQAQPGDVIHVGPGTFSEQVTIRAKGTADAPIILQGTRGDDGQWLTRISPGKPVDPATWQPAPDIGPNVYHNSSFDQQPSLLTIDGRFVAHIHRNAPAFRQEGQALDVLRYPDDHVATARRREARFWDVIHSLFMHHPDENDPSIYLRLPGDQDPRNHQFMASTGGAGITANAAQHLIVRDLAISEAFEGVRVTGRDTQHVTIERCHITHGMQRIRITDHASHITVRDNDLAMGFHGMTPGAWAGGTTPVHNGRCYQYYYFKNIHHRQRTSNDRAIQLDGDASHLLIENNRLIEGLIGFQAGPVRNVIIRGNTVRHFSSVGVALRRGAIDVHMVDNELYDNSINLRLHQLGDALGHRLYVYNNRLKQPDTAGQHIFCYVSESGVSPPYPEPEIFIYHNTMLGGYRGWNLPASNTDFAGIPRVSGFLSGA